ncbi:MAG TPA: DUF2075 domain-containing protein [Burkholderiales bacterium]|nr:DUF2075 domain-containing protein [Burkholderiales bacterium]
MALPDLRSRAWYHAPSVEFLAAHDDAILGQLVRNSDFPVDETQGDAWVAEIGLLKACLQGVDGTILLEFNIPRMGARIDAVLLVGPIVFVLEFKVGAKTFDRGAIDQVWDYGLDLKNFHAASHEVPIVPVLVATEAQSHLRLELERDDDNLYRPARANAETLASFIRRARQSILGAVVEDSQWARAPYQPTPTIVEAARALYASHSVEAIARFDAGRANLRVTSRRIEELVDEARRLKRKSICFVTGVPGAGKTLVGLNIATHKSRQDDPTHAVFLSGNGPLVAVLREALTRDEVVRRRAQREKVRKGKIATSVKQFIQNVHHFRDDALAHGGPPDEHVVIFDEAQRAWDLRQTARFMHRKKKRPGFNQSEPEFLIAYMNRHPDWAVVVCLVGGGQEINTGEAGITAWLEAVNKSFPDWQIYISSRLTDSEYAAGKAVEVVRSRNNTCLEDDLHLAVSMRSFRAERVSEFVKALLDREPSKARDALKHVQGRYPIVMTRNLDVAKEWVRSRARGSERFGLVASSKAIRLKPYAVDIRVKVDPVHWFLNEKEDIRSSYYLEDAATEFQVQGLELDWTCVTWDGDLRFTRNDWSYHDFRGSKWTNVSNEDNRNYLRNAYRVLLTRARQGMVIFVPPGDLRDPTRLSGYYDPTFQYLAEIGVPILNGLGPQK